MLPELYTYARPLNNPLESWGSSPCPWGTHRSGEEQAHTPLFWVRGPSAGSRVIPEQEGRNNSGWEAGRCQTTSDLWTELGSLPRMLSGRDKDWRVSGRVGKMFQADGTARAKACSQAHTGAHTHSCAQMHPSPKNWASQKLSERCYYVHLSQHTAQILTSLWNPAVLSSRGLSMSAIPCLPSHQCKPSLCHQLDILLRVLTHCRFWH